MFVLLRLIILSVPAFWVGGMELVRKSNEFLFPVAIFFLVYLFFTVFMICRGRADRVFWHFLILPLVFALGGFAFLLFLTSATAFHVLAILTGLALYLVLHQYFIYFNFPVRYQPYTLENLTFYNSLFLLFFIFSSVFASLILIKWNIFILILVMLPALGLIAYKFFWVHKIDWSRSWLLILIIVLLQLELFGAVSYLPTSYYVDAFILTLASYLMYGLGRAAVQGGQNRRQTIGQIIVVLVLLLTILLTAKWG